MEINANESFNSITNYNHNCCYQTPNREACAVSYTRDDSCEFIRDIFYHYYYHYYQYDFNIDRYPYHHYDSFFISYPF